MMHNELNWQKMAKLDNRERRLLEIIRKLQFGELTIKVQDGLPVMVEKSIEKVKL